MMRLCPKCGDYYADDWLAFCLVDGTPLVNVDPLSERWSEGARVVEEKENALRKQKRTLKWRRVLLSVMTILIATLVVCVVVVNSFIYLKPRPEENVTDKPLTAASAPAGFNASKTPSRPGTPIPAQKTPQPTVTPKPPTRDTKSPAALPATPTPPTPTPSSAPTLTSTPRPTPDDVPECSDADKSRERESIISRFGNIWRRNIEGNRRKIIAANAQDNLENAEASLGAIEYTSTFSQTCRAGVITARYVWQVRTNVNGAIKVATVAQESRFRCVKIGGMWLCA